MPIRLVDVDYETIFASPELAGPRGTRKDETLLRRAGPCSCLGTGIAAAEVAVQPLVTKVPEFCRRNERLCCFQTLYRTS